MIKFLALTFTIVSLSLSSSFAEGCGGGGEKCDKPTDTAPAATPAP